MQIIENKIWEGSKIMGRSHRPKPERLAEKLRQIRMALGLSQTEMVKRLDYTKTPLKAPEISLFENDKREPPLPILLRYARVSGVTVEEIIDDEMDLPEGF